MRKLLVVAALLAAFVTFAQPAAADTISMDFTVANSTTALGTFASYGTVTLTLLGNGDIHFDVDMADGLRIVNQAIGFNTALTGLSLLNVTSNYGPLQSNPHPGNIDGFGSYNYIVDAPNPGIGGAAVNEITFDIAIAGGFTSVNQLVNLNDKGYYFASHIQNPEQPLPNTGDVAAPGGTSTVPEPASLMLLGGGLAGLGTVIRRRRRS